MTDDEIDQRFPHQVILPSACYAASEFRSIHAFCIGMSLADRGHLLPRLQLLPQLGRNPLP